CTPRKKDKYPLVFYAVIAAATPESSRLGGEGRTWRSPRGAGRALVRGADAVQVLQRADEELPVGRRRRRVAFLVERVAAAHGELVARPEHPRLAVVVEEVEVAARGHGRGAVVPAELVLPQSPAGPRVQATRPASVGDDVDVRAVGDERRH